MAREVLPHLERLQPMNQRQRNITTTVIVALAIAAACVWWAARKVSERNSAAKQEEIRAERAEHAERELRTSVENMATKYNAVTNWGNLFGEQHSGRVFTIDVEEALRPTNGHPVLIVGRITNLAMRNGKSYVNIYYDRRYPKHLKIYYILQCDSDLANSIKKHGRDSDAAVSVIAAIDAVKMPDLEATAEALNDEEAEIDIAPAESPFEASGRCIDLLFMTSDHLE